MDGSGNGAAGRGVNGVAVGLANAYARALLANWTPLDRVRDFVQAYLSEDGSESDGTLASASASGGLGASTAGASSPLHLSLLFTLSSANSPTTPSPI